MQILFLNPKDTFFVDIIAWILFHLSIGYFSAKIPLKSFHPGFWLYRDYPWEKGGKFYDRIFHVHSWKRFIPGLGKFTSNKFSLQNLESANLDYLTAWLKESCRAEICHWVMIIPGFLFFLWNSVEVGWWMVAYAFTNNLIPIIMQRYNRPRIRKMIKVLERSASTFVFDVDQKADNEETPAHSYC